MAYYAHYFNSFSYIYNLKKAGVSQEAAEIQANTLKNIIEQLESQSKYDMELMRKDFKLEMINYVYKIISFLMAAFMYGVFLLCLLL